MAIHIGKIIQTEVEKKGLTQKEFVALIYKHKKKVPNIYDRTSISIDLLVTISAALNIDLLKYYYEEEPLKSLRENEKIKEIIKLKEEIERLIETNERLDREILLRRELNDAHNAFISQLTETLYGNRNAKELPT